MGPSFKVPVLSTSKLQVGRQLLELTTGLDIDLLLRLDLPAARTEQSR